MYSGCNYVSYKMYLLLRVCCIETGLNSQKIRQVVKPKNFMRLSKPLYLGVKRSIPKMLIIIPYCIGRLQAIKYSKYSQSKLNQEIGL